MARTLNGPPRRPSGPGVSDTGKAGQGAARRRRGPGGGRGRRPSGKAALFAVLGIAIIAGMAWALLGPRLLVVRTVRVIGAGRAVPAAQVLAAAHVPRGVPLIRVDTSAIARQVEQLRQVQAAEVSKDWPSTVVITVVPRTPVFTVRSPGGYALVDRFGVSITETTSRPPGLPLLSVGSAVTLRGNPAVQAAARVLAELPPRVARRVRAVSATSPADVSVTLANGAVVIWGNTGNARVKAKELTLLMRRNARTYDVSGPGTVMVSR